MPMLAQVADAERQRANQENVARYQQALTEMTNARQRMTSLFAAARAQLANQGKTAAADIDRGAAAQQAQNIQGLMSAGLANTTVRSAVARGTEQDRVSAQARLSEGVAAQKAGLLTQQAQAEMGGAQAMTNLIGSRTDVGPDMGMYANLVRQANAGPSAWQASGGQVDIFDKLGFRTPGGGGAGAATPASQAQYFGPGMAGAGLKPEDAAAQTAREEAARKKKGRLASAGSQRKPYRITSRYWGGANQGRTA
jgi:hypothetical protein